MNRPIDVENFIYASFDSLCLFYDDYFGYRGASGKMQRISVVQDGAVDRGVVAFASRILGISEKDIMDCNYDLLYELTERYSYFDHWTNLNRAYEENMCGPRYAEYKLMDAIFCGGQQMPVWYNWPAVHKRLCAQLKELNKYLPGTYHHEAEMTDIKVSVQKICHYDGIKDFIEEYLKMLERAGKLFFKAVAEDLCEDEINEYNLLVSLLGIRDFVFSETGNLYYDNLLRCREIYRREALPNFYDYITLDRERAFDPWRCAEFIEDKDLVQKYINYHPYFKHAMRDFAMKVLNFKFDFAWSDARKIYVYEGHEISKEDYELIFREPIPESLRTLERTEVFVPKTSGELGDNEDYAKKLLVLCGPEKLGGIVYPPYRNVPDDVGSAKRITERMSLIRSTNYYEWYEQTYNQPLVPDENDGGGSDE